jgi:hypothetical protein
MANEGVLLGSLLELREPWAVREFRFEPARQRLDVWIGLEVQRGWFGRPKARVEEEPERVWRHLNSAGWRTFVHVIPPKGADLSSQPWTGAPDLPFTRAMAKRIFGLMNEGVELSSIGTLYGIAFDELWRFKFALDNGKAGIQVTSTGHSTAASKPAAASAAPVAEAAKPSEDGVPDVTDPVWLQLASGTIEPDIRVLSLKLMLTRIRSQMELIEDDEVRMLKLRELHRYFAKNARMLSHELAQLREV